MTWARRSQVRIEVVGRGCIAWPGYGEELVEHLLRPPPFSPACGPRRIADFDASAYLKMRGLRPLSRASKLIAVAAGGALDAAGALPGAPERHGVALGIRWASLDPLVELNHSALLNGPRQINPSDFPNVVANAHAGYLGVLFGLGGPNLTVSGPSAGLEALGCAADALSLERADAMVVGGVEALGLALTAAVSAPEVRTHADLPAAEAAACLVLAATNARASERGRAALVGWGMATAHSASDLDQARAVAIGQALRDAPRAPIASVWYAGDEPHLPQLATARVCSATQLVGACGAAGGALAALLAAEHVARDRTPALALDLPSHGSQVAALFAP